MRCAACLLALTACNPVIYYSDERLDQLSRRVSAELGDGFTVQQVDRFWILASNASAEDTREAARLIGLAARALRRVYFEREADRAVRVYMFRDEQSYNAYCGRNYADPPRTPFGFYMPRERKIVLNVSRGHGTLVHELVHPLMEADFPRAPPWFNEGFASLFEHAKIGEDSIEGRVNWRLRALKRVLAQHDYSALAHMLSLSRDDFYGANAGNNYAVARYLCLYLQHKGLLVKFYAEFRKSASGDASGRAVLQNVTGRMLSELEAEWRRWVGGLAEGSETR
jgi:hypothetical protein